jgi:putative transposase
LDEYSRYIVHYELLTSMDGNSVSLAAQRAVETLPRDGTGRLIERPEIRTDNGSGYVSREFRGVLAEHELAHQRIKPHCPEEPVLQHLIGWYNHQRLHRALGYLRPVDDYRGDPAAHTELRRRKLATARHQRKEANLRLQQRSLPLQA